MFRSTKSLFSILALTAFATMTGCADDAETIAACDEAPPAAAANEVEGSADAAPAHADESPSPAGITNAADAASANTDGGSTVQAKVDSSTETRDEPAIDPIATNHLEVSRLVLAKGVEDREPVDAADAFSIEDLDRIYAFVEVQNPERGPSEVIVTFEPPDGGAATGNVHLSVGASPRWRTWAFTRGADQLGTWDAVVRTPDGRELARRSFDVTL